jgi:hypothetical protein
MRTRMTTRWEATERVGAFVTNASSPPRPLCRSRAGRRDRSAGAGGIVSDIRTAPGISYGWKSKRVLGASDFASRRRVRRDIGSDTEIQGALAHGGRLRAPGMPATSWMPQKAAMH